MARSSWACRHTFVSLDSKLRASAGFDLGMKGTDVADLHWLGGKDWLDQGTGVDGRVSVGLAAATDARSGPPHGDEGGRDHDVQTDHAARDALARRSRPRSITAIQKLAANRTHLASLPKLKGYEQTELVPVSPALAVASS